MELKRAAGTALKDHAVRELQRLLPEPNGEVKQLIDELTGNAPPP